MSPEVAASLLVMAAVSAPKPVGIDSGGLLDSLTWIVIMAAAGLACVVQALKAYGVKPPLSIREILTRSFAAGATALTLGLLLVGSGKIGIHWALYIGAGGVIGYLGMEAMDLAVQYLKKKFGLDDPPAGGTS